MTSDESAKSAFQDRNSFNIARRSEEEVAAEIAARLSAWKQARSRDNLTPEPISRPVRPIAGNSPGSSPGNSMVRPASMNASATQAAQAGAKPHRSTAPLPNIGVLADEWGSPAQRVEPRIAPETATERPVVEPIAAGPSALDRAVPEAPSPSRPTRAFPFRVGTPRPQEPASSRVDPPIDPSQPLDIETPEIETSEIEAPGIEAPGIKAQAEIEMPYVDSAAVQAPDLEQIMVKRLNARPRAASIPSPVIETWEDEEAAIAAASIPKLAIPERLTVPPTARHAARAGTGWAMILGAILLFMGVTLPAALWQHPEPAEQEMATVSSVPPPEPAPVETATAPAVQMPDAPQPAMATSEPVAEAPQVPVPSVSSSIAERKMQHVMAPYETLSNVQSAEDIESAPVNVPTAAGPRDVAPEEVASADVPEAFPPAAQPFVPGVESTHILVPPPGAVKKPVARLKPAASAAVPPETPAMNKPATKTAAKPVVRKPKGMKSQLERMMDELSKILSNGQPPNPKLQPDSPGTRR